MYQTDRGTYNKKESIFHMFYHSCFGKFVILIGACLVLYIIAMLTVPSEQKMKDEMIDNIRQCIEANDSIKNDWIDDAVNNVGYIFTEADSTVNKELMATFNKYNKLEIFRHTWYSTARIRNNFRTEGVRVGIGIFGVVIPTVNFNDFLMRVGPVRRDYDQKLIQNSYSTDDYMGDNPDLGNTFDTYQGGGSDF